MLFNFPSKLAAAPHCSLQALESLTLGKLLLGEMPLGNYLTLIFFLIWSIKIHVIQIDFEELNTIILFKP